MERNLRGQRRFVCGVSFLGSYNPVHPRRSQSPYLEGSAPKEKGPLRCTALCLFSNTP